MTSINKNFINLVNICKFKDGSPAVFLDTINAVDDQLQQLGYQTKQSTNVILQDAINIIWGVGSPFSPTYDEIRSIAKPENSIIFNMEQIASDSNLVTSEYLNFLSNYVVLDYNQKNLNILKNNLGVNGYEFPLMPSVKFNSDYDSSISFEKKYDLAFYGTLNSRREKIIQDIERLGISIKVIKGAYGLDLPAAISDCKAVLNLHYYETSIFEIARCLRPLAMGFPIISEISVMPSSVDWNQSGIFFLKPENFEEHILEILNSNEKLLESVQKTIKYINHKSHKEKLETIFNKLLVNF
jgi:hypothetical protein